MIAILGGLLYSSREINHISCPSLLQAEKLTNIIEVQPCKRLTHRMPFNYGYFAVAAKVIVRQIQRAGLITSALNLPILYLPGILGSQLYDRKNKRLIWGDYNSLIRKNNYEYSDIPYEISAMQLHRFSVIPGLIESLITSPLKRVLETALGYRDGIDLFFLGHDWRADNRLLAQQLSDNIKKIKQIYGAHQKILIIAHSSSNCAIRHYLQSASQQERDSIAKWYAFGPPWAGTFQSLHLMHSGYYPAGKFFHGFTPDEISSCPSAYQLLPASAQVIDKQGNLIEYFDIYDEACWKAFHLGPYRSGPTAVCASTERVREKLAENLNNAKAFSQHVATRSSAESVVPQTWFLSDNHVTVKYAIYDNEHLYVNAKVIQKQFPHLTEFALTKGDDHLPIDGLLEGWKNPVIHAPDTPPFGENYVFVNQAGTHRKLVSHVPNLRILAFDIATLNQRIACEQEGKQGHV